MHEPDPRLAFISLHSPFGYSIDSSGFKYNLKATLLSKREMLFITQQKDRTVKHQSGPFPEILFCQKNKKKEKKIGREIFYFVLLLSIWKSSHKYFLLLVPSPSMLSSFSNFFRCSLSYRKYYRVCYKALYKEKFLTIYNYSDFVWYIYNSELTYWRHIVKTDNTLKSYKYTCNN